MFLKKQFFIIIVMLILVSAVGCSKNETNHISKDNHFQGVWETELMELESGYEQVVLYIIDSDALIQIREYSSNKASYSVPDQGYLHIEDINAKNTNLLTYSIDYETEKIVINKDFKLPMELIGDEIHLKYDDENLILKYKAEVNIDEDLDSFKNIESIARRAIPDYPSLSESLDEYKAEKKEKEELLKEKEREEAEIIKNYPYLSENKLIEHSKIKEKFSSNLDDLTITAVRFTGKRIPEILVVYNLPGVDSNRNYTNIYSKVHIYQFDGKKDWVEIYSEEYYTNQYFSGTLKIDDLKNEHAVFMMTGGMIVRYQSARVLFYLDNTNKNYANNNDGWVVSKSNDMFGEIVFDADEGVGGEITTDSNTNSIAFNHDENKWIYKWNGREFKLQ